MMLMTNKRNKKCKYYSYDPQSGWDTCAIAENPLFFNCKECTSTATARKETETWQTSKGNVEMPKGLFDKIYEDNEE